MCVSHSIDTSIYIVEGDQIGKDMMQTLLIVTESQKKQGTKPYTMPSPILDIFSLLIVQVMLCNILNQINFLEYFLIKEQIL